MPSDPTKRVSNWDLGYNTARIKEITDAKRPAMWARVQAVLPDLYAMEMQVKQTLDAKGVANITYPFYLNFGRELWHLHRLGMSGPAAAREAATLIAKWKDRGLSQAVLEAIRSEVFNIGPPSP